MKNLYVFFAFILLTQASFSQSRFGIRGGLNLANQKVTASYMGEKASQSGDGIVSFHAGGMAEIPLGGFLYLQPSLLFTGKGSNFEGTDGFGNPTTAKLRLYYIELPVDLVAKKELPSGSKIYAGAGLAPAYGVTGKAKSDSESSDAFSSDGFKRFDLGVNLSAGIEIPAGFVFSFRYTPGLINITNFSESGIDIKWKNSVAGFSVGYFLNTER